jgi:hypothetical protein
MRHLALKRQVVRLALAGALATTGVLATTTAAHADTLPATTCSGFLVDQTILTDMTKEISNPSGNRFTGHLLTQYTNLSTGKSVTLNVSGAETVSQDKNILTITYTGPAFLNLGPNGQNNAHVSGISYLRGRAVVTVDLDAQPQPTVTSLTTTAPVTDVCKLLA